MSREAGFCRQQLLDQQRGCETVIQHPIGLDPELTGATQEQRRVHDLIARGPRGSVPTPFLAMLDAPDIVAAIQEVGVAIRFRGCLSDDQRELAILASAGAVGCGYEWRYHAPLAEHAGVAAAQIAATLEDELPADLDRTSSIIIDFCREAVLGRRVRDDLLTTAIVNFGRPGTTELIAIAGYYALLASFLFIGGHDCSPPGPA